MTQNQFICNYCNRSFTRKYNLQTHIENCHLKSSCHCDICDQNFGSPAGLALHLSRGHNRYGQSYPECELCGRVFTRKQNIICHMMTVHLQGVGPEIKCYLCCKTFSTERNLKRHMNQIHNPNMQYPTCDECGKVFKGKHSLISHIQTWHNAKCTKAIKCELCDKSYTNNRNLKRHIEMLHGEKEEFKCTICPKVYTSNQSLKRHAKTRHNPDSEAQYQCEFCDLVITGKDNLDSHVSYFHRMGDNEEYNEFETPVKIDKAYTCETCGVVLDKENILRQHIKSEHSFEIFYKYCKQSLLRQAGKEVSRNDVSYKCEYCNNTFNNVYDLKDHMRLCHDKEYSLSTCNVCFTKFYSKGTMIQHKKICIPPPNVNSCTYCDKLFTDVSSLEFHVRIFHPQAQIADSNVSSTNVEDNIDSNSYKCKLCDRIYYSDRSLRHHMKLKHTTDEAMECEMCGKICSNKYYLASHIKMVHNDDSWSKCDYCDKVFKTKRNIRRHIEYTHLGMQRYKCIECETLFKEKRSLRKHVRTKHPNSTMFPQCHFCHKRFESAKSCKIHLKLLHSFNMNTYPCHLCSVSFSSKEALNIHLSSKHLAEDEIYKCEECNLVFKGQEKFERHNELCHVNLVPTIKQKVLPRCIICMKDFSTRKTLKRHIKKFHNEFDVEELATFGCRKRVFNVDCEECIKNFQDDFYCNIYQKLKHLRDSIIFKCEFCKCSYDSLEFSIQRYKILNFDACKSKMILSELCTTEMSDEETNYTGFGSLHEYMEPESTTNDISLEQGLRAEDEQTPYAKDIIATLDNIKMEKDLFQPIIQNIKMEQDLDLFEATSTNVQYRQNLISEENIKAEPVSP